MWVNSIQIRDGALSKAELAALSTPTSGGIPVQIPTFATGLPGLKIQIVSGKVLVTWSGGSLQQADNVAGPYTDIAPQPVSPWCIVQPAVKKFFRVRQ